MAPRVRIFGGCLHGALLTSPRGSTTRPTTGRVREAVFNILGDSFEGRPVLDLFAGTGSLGIEAVSRGAARATFVDSAGDACKAVGDSLRRCDIAERCTVIKARLPAALARLDETFAIIFLDPPYEGDSGPGALVKCGALLAPNGTLVYEHRSSYNPPEQPPSLKLVDRRTYGDTAIALYQSQEHQ